MASGTQRQLEQAYNLIQKDDLEGALTILRPVVSVQPDNGEAWWLIANAVSEPVEAYEALNNVVRLNPQNREAKEQLDNLLEQFPDVASQAAPAATFEPAESMDSFSVDELLGPSPTKSGAPAPENYDSMFGKEAAGDDSALDLDSFFGSGTEAKAEGADSSEDAALDAFFTGSPAPSKPAEKPGRGRGRGKAPQQEETFTEPTFMDEAQAPVEQAAKGRAKEEKKPKPTKIQAPKEERVVDALEIERRANRRPNRSLVFLLLAALIVLAGGVFIVFVLPNIGKAPAIPAPVSTAMNAVETVLKANNFNGVKADWVNDTLQATICDKAGPALQDTFVKAMDLVAREAAAIKDSIKAAGVVVVNCNKTDVTILHEVAPINAIVSYVSGNMADKRDFRASWIKQ